MGSVSSFIQRHYRHFNAGELSRAAEGYRQLLDSGGQMVVALGGAMSTAELGLSLAEMIRMGKVHAISCTGANFEEDVFNLIAHNSYLPVPHYRQLRPVDEEWFAAHELNRITDTCLPNGLIWERLEGPLMDAWREADRSGRRLYPHEALCHLLADGALEAFYQIDPLDSWVLAAVTHSVPIFVPAWEDSSTGNMYTAACMRGEVQNVGTVRSGPEVMIQLARWYTETSLRGSIGLFQVGGGVAGDFAMCVVPMLHEDLDLKEVPRWKYFCQVGDSTTSYGSYSGAPPGEKITWGKLDATTPAYMIESDATIVVPLIFAAVLGW